MNFKYRLSENTKIQPIYNSVTQKLSKDSGQFMINFDS